MANNEIVIVCKRVKFYSKFDEAAFFESLEKIKSIGKVEGKGDSILLTMSDSSISDEDLDKLVGLFRRYKISMKQLEGIVNDTNRELFYDYQRGYHINVYPANQK